MGAALFNSTMRGSFAHSIKHLGMRVIARALAGRRLVSDATGLANIPSDGALVLAARHYHHLFDGVALYQTVPREIHILVTLDWAPNQTTRFLMESAIRLAGWPLVLRRAALAFKPDGSRAQTKTVFKENDVACYQRRALRQAVDLLMGGAALLIFPEGFPNIDPNFTPKTKPDEFLPFSAGFAVIAAAAEKRLGTAVPVVPVGLNYTAGAQWCARINFGTSLYARDFATRRDFVQEVENAVIRLSR